MYILTAVVVIIIVVAGVAAYIFLYSGGDGGNGGNGNGGETVYTVANATSLKFNVDITDPDNVTAKYTLAGKNLGTAEIWLRVDIEGEGATYSYIMFAGNQTSFANLDGTWAESDFAVDWPGWSVEWTAYVTNLASWSGTGNYSYTDAGGNSIVISNIQVQAVLADSLFQPT